MRRAPGAGLAMVGAALAACAPADSPAPPAWGDDFERGPFAVGFRTFETERTTARNGRRSLTLAVWYPASAPSSDRVRVEDFYRLVAAQGQLEEGRGLSMERGFAAVTTGDSMAFPPQTARTLLDAPTLAWRDASPAEGAFPIVLWGVRHATALAQAPLSEALASRGFVVAAAWSADPPLAFLWEDHPREDKIATIEAHAGDLAHALETLRGFPHVDASRVVALAWSYGGQSAARLQERERAVRGTVSLDANVLPAGPEERLELRRPLIALVGADTLRRGLEGVDELPAPWVMARFPELGHGNFNAMESYVPGLVGARAYFPWTRGDRAVDGYRLLGPVVLRAVEALMAGDASAEALAAHLREGAGRRRIEIRTGPAR